MLRMRDKEKSIVQEIILVAIIFFVIYMIIWAMFVNKVYRPYWEGLGGTYMTCKVEEEDCYYEVASPKMGRFEGHVQISLTEPGGYGEDGMKVIGMILYPQINGELEIQIALETERQVNTSIYIDENMQPITTSDMEDRQLFSAHKEEIKEFFQIAYDIWGILELEE